MKPFKTYPEKLKKGDEVRIIAPSRSLAIISEETRKIANKRFKDLGLRLSFGKNLEENDEFNSSSVPSRIQDLHDAFSDKDVKAIFTVIGGFNGNQLLRYINWDLIKKNPKIFCGYSDITVLNNSIFAKTGLVSYSGPNYSTFGQELHFEYTLEYFKKCLLNNKLFEINPSEKWSDDAWYKNQKKRNLINNEGLWVINKGSACGTIIGGNLCTLNLIQGTEYFPSLKNSILFLEDDYESLSHTFDRDFQSLIHLPSFVGVKGIIIGRFQKRSKMKRKALEKIIKTKKELEKIPVLANADFGHTYPIITFPIGGEASFSAEEYPRIEITKN